MLKLLIQITLISYQIVGYHFHQVFLLENIFICFAIYFWFQLCLRANIFTNKIYFEFNKKEPGKFWLKIIKFYPNLETLCNKFESQRSHWLYSSKVYPIWHATPGNRNNTSFYIHCFGCATPSIIGVVTIKRYRPCHIVSQEK